MDRLGESQWPIHAAVVVVVVGVVVAVDDAEKGTNRCSGEDRYSWEEYSLLSMKDPV